jgi:hypothetical protein
MLYWFLFARFLEFQSSTNAIALPHVVQFLNVKEYTKGIAVYEEIIKAYSSYAPDIDSHAEL